MQLDWPPAFTLRFSARVRRVRVQICPRRGLQVVAPLNFNPKKADGVLLQHREWIERTWMKIRPDITQQENATLPTGLNLLAINEIWGIHYSEDSNLTLDLNPVTGRNITVRKKNLNADYAHYYLKNWLLDQGQYHLLPWLKRLSELTGLKYSSANIRNNTSRWGSCSASKRISLNCKLLFLPAHLVEHILIHELCHTVHMNHSAAFWQLVTRFSPECSLWRKQMKDTQKYMPRWLE
jgi:predicted metal-dependent hydrolase